VNHPKARRSGVVIGVDDAGVHIGGRELPPLAAFVWTHADGTHDVTALAHIARQALGTTIDTETVWLALDVLADANLLEERIAPPAAARHHWTRRETLHAAGAALVVLGALFPRSVAGDDALSPQELDATARQALRDAEAARQRGDTATAEEKLGEAKEASRKKTTAERDAEQNSKNERSQRFDDAPSRAAPTPGSSAAAAADNQPALPAPASTPHQEDTGLDRKAPAPAVDDRQRHYQEQELKRTQERNLKRIP
jgi:hypothetical protein